MGVLLTISFVIGLAFTLGFYILWVQLDDDVRYDIADQWRWTFQRLRWKLTPQRWRPKHVSGSLELPIPNFISQLYRMSPTDSPFLRMIGKKNKTLTAGEYSWSDKDEENDDAS